MLLYFDLDLKKVVTAPGSQLELTQSVEAKRGQEEELAIVCIRAFNIVQLGDNEQLKAVIKPRGKYDGDALVSVSGDAFTWDAASQLYRAQINYEVSALDTLFFIDDNPDNDVASLSLALELGHRLNNSAKWRRSENNIDLLLNNNYLRDDAGAPDPEDIESEEFISDRAVRHDQAQTLTDAAADQARQNLKMVYDATKGGIIWTLEDGTDVFIPVTAMPA